MICFHSLINSLNDIYKLALWLIHKYHVQSFQNKFGITNEKTVHHKNLECLLKKIYKFLHDLFLPIMNDVLQIRENIYNLWNLQSLHSNSKETVKFGTTSVTHRIPQIWNSILRNFKNAFYRSLQKEIEKWKD